MAVSPVLADRGGERFLALDSLVSPYGVVASVGPVRSRFRGPGELVEASATAGWGVRTGQGTRTVGKRCKVLSGGGRAMKSPEHARLVAIAEAAERYAGCDILGEPRVWAKAAELDGPVLDPGRYPRCSAAEYSAAGCPVRPFDPDARIRWVRGLELTGGGPVWVPAAMACYGLQHRVAGEHFSYPISTGYAVHTDPVEALVGGICEVIERDALSLVWRQRLPIPLSGPGASSPATDYLASWAERHFIQTYLFDATTDLGVPTVYCLQVAEHDRRARHVVGCAAGRNMALAAEKALLEALGVRGLFYSDDDIPSDYAKFSGLTDGARYMGTPERSAAFDFLVDGAGQRPVVHREALPADPGAVLARLIAIFTEREMPVAVVDRTTRELAAAGLTCVSVVIPDLQPMSLQPLAQFLAHPRLYDAPARMGYRVSTEGELNPWPQPFA
jgi:ribosomal protein S12 methylthiotransferase accessory factor